MNLKSFILILSLGVSLFSSAQTMRYENAVYMESIKTVLLSKNINIYDPVPIIALNSSETLVLEFDHLQPQNEYFTYTLIHCDAQWNPSELQQVEYMEGNPVGEITNFTYSTNTYQTYVHYKLVFPQQGMKLTKSGNYLLKVFNNFNENELVLTRRFMVLDQKVGVTATVNGGTMAKYRYTHQEVDVEVDHAGFIIPNPYTDVSMTIVQNNSWETAIFDLKPLFVSNNTLSFNYEEGNLFPGGNEFRYFDIRSLRFFSNQVAEKYFDTLTNVVLTPDEPRSHLTYVYWVDYNGQRVVTNKDGSNVVADGDYALVHFILLTQDKRDLGDMYIYGELSDWQLKDEFKMEYDSLNGFYSGTVLLKQSYYDYMYVMKDKQGKLEFDFTEGTHRETENDYYILIYHRNQFYNYDELVGYVRKNTTSTSR